jgi:HSP20 family molecular chaperone IbpA
MLPALRRNYEKGLTSGNLFEEFFGKNGFFDDFFSDLTASTGVIWNVNDDGDVVYQVECPGFNDKNLNVEIADGFVEITGKREVDGKFVGSREIHQRFTVGKPEDVKAQLKDGILYLTLSFPKREKSKVKIEVSEN